MDLDGTLLSKSSSMREVNSGGHNSARREETQLMQCMAMRCCMKEDLTRYELKVSEDEARSPEKMKAAISRHLAGSNKGPKERDV